MRYFQLSFPGNSCVSVTAIWPLIGLTHWNWPITALHLLSFILLIFFTRINSCASLSLTPWVETNLAISQAFTGLFQDASIILCWFVRTWYCTIWRWSANAIIVYTTHRLTSCMQWSDDNHDDNLATAIIHLDDWIIYRLG